MLLYHRKTVDAFLKMPRPGTRNILEIGSDIQCEVAMRPLKNVHFCSSSRKAKILTTGIH